MSLTLGPGPLGTQPGGDANYSIDGPRHRIWFQPHPRRMRAEVAGRTLLDTTSGYLLHESNIPPRLYVPAADLDRDLLVPTDHTTHCPFKGDASYHSIVVGDATRQNAVWSYPRPKPEAAWLAPFASVYWEMADAWYEEDERVPALRDPYHRVDVRRTSRPARVATAGAVEVARSGRGAMVYETGAPPRRYLPREDVTAELVASEKRSLCPYKGQASYFGVRLGDRLLEDAAWSYEEPFAEAAGVRGLVSFLHDDLTTTVG
jgi:uncharacterized protein (DUF427 family)